MPTAADFSPLKTSENWKPEEFTLFIFDNFRPIFIQIWPFPGEKAKQVGTNRNTFFLSKAQSRLEQNSILALTAFVE